MQRRQFILTALAAATVARPGLAAPAALEVFKSPTCGCCAAWVAHMTEAGFDVTARDVDQQTLWSIKDRAGIPEALSSCHTGFVSGYAIEGHVPASDVLRLLAERPDAIGLTVPGMPFGSPGMEMGNRRDPYDTLLVLNDGAARVFQQHGR